MKPLTWIRGVVTVAVLVAAVVPSVAHAAPTDPTGHVSCSYSMALHDFSSGYQRGGTAFTLLSGEAGAWYTTDHSAFPNGRMTNAQCTFADTDAGEPSDVGANDSTVYQAHPIMGVNWSTPVLNACALSADLAVAAAIDTPEGNYIVYLGYPRLVGGAFAASGSDVGITLALTAHVAPAEWGSSVPDDAIRCVGPTLIENFAATGTIEAHLYEE